MNLFPIYFFCLSLCRRFGVRERDGIVLKHRHNPNSINILHNNDCVLSLTLSFSRKWHFDGTEDNRHKSISKYVIKFSQIQHIHIGAVSNSMENT